jgi:hypothetical protein
MPRREALKELRPHLARVSRDNTAIKLWTEILKSQNERLPKNSLTSPELNLRVYSADAAEMRRGAVGLHPEAASNLDLE